MAACEFREARRVLTSVLAPAERRLLIYVAARLPAWINSDHLTALAVVGMAAAGGSYWLAGRTAVGFVLATVALGVNWFGDSLDGTLARVRNQPRPRYGFYVDHIVDVIGSCFLLGGLALSGYMSPSIAAGLLVAYLVLCIEIYLATYCVGEFRISFWGAGPTELRLLLAAGNLTAMIHPSVNVIGSPYLLFDVGGVVAIASLTITAIASAWRNTRLLYAAEPLPNVTPASRA